ncbi:MAG: hypothetical protein A3F16_07035 [Deltaproteobacteria bacterium RIFCSPHIGHO2_12_FULL_43_9]|nr:MAG: hypothetical protein A3F16_07035 [Deltaproteobacteria bacterium RIFCSPHIGHO2_12_FULL_43_9]
MLSQISIKRRQLFFIIWGLVLTFCVLSFLFLDIPIARALKGQRPHWWNITLYELTTYGLAEYYLVPSALLAIIFFIAGRKTRGEIKEKLYNISLKVSFLFLSVAASGILTNILKILIGRSRPRMLFYTGEYGFQGLNFDVDHWSFPSGHATTVASFITALFIVTPPKKRIYLTPFVIMAFLIIVSRVTVQAHFLSDIVFSTYWAATVTIILYSFLQRFLPRLSEIASLRSQ